MAKGISSSGYGMQGQTTDPDDVMDDGVDQIAVDLNGEVGVLEDEDAARDEIRIFEEKKKQQQAILEELKKNEFTSAAESRATRLNYLMKQSEVFAHFLTGGDSAAFKEDDNGSSKKKKKAGRTRLTEEDEDKEMMKLAQAKAVLTRLSTQPMLITGGEMRSYQLEGLNWMIKLHDNNINGILADEMGLGKTLQTISLVAYLKEARKICGPHLIIVPKAVVSNWMRECNRWCPSLKVIKLLGTKEERAKVCKEEMLPGKFEVCICSYESVLLESRYILKYKWKYVIIDEAHRIKNENSSLAIMVRRMKTDFKILITGTPLQNNLHELWALLNFLLPDVFDSSDAFNSWFNTEDALGKENVIKRLHTVLKPFLLRRVKADVEKSLPPKKETKLYIGLTAMQKAWYTNLLSKDIETLNSLGKPDRMRLLNVLMQLRKICNHPYLFDGAEEGPPFINGPHIWDNCGKMILLHKLLPKLNAAGSRVLIFTQMTRMLDILEDYILLNGYKYCRLDGSTKSDERDVMMDEFNKKGSDKFIFLLSTRAGGLGINLQTADTVILYDSDWNPQVDLQAMDRAHRIGQTKEVRVFRFISEGSVEEKIVERADRKLFLDAAVIQQGRLAEKHGNALSKGEILTMVRFGADEIMSSKDGTLTDEDIDVLLARGEERTNSMNEKITTEMQHNLANFSVGLDEHEEINLFTFEGENWKDKSKMPKIISSGELTFISLPQRDRKLKSGSASNGTNQNKPPAAKKKKNSYPDHQLYDRKRLEIIAEEESTLTSQKQLKLLEIRDLLNKHKREARKGVRKSSGGDDDDNDDDNLAMDVSEVKIEFEEEAKRIQMEIDSGLYDLPADLAEEKKTLLAAAFPDFSRRDYKIFTDAIENYGRSDNESLIHEVSTLAQKPTEYIERYMESFFQKFKGLPDWNKVVEKIEKGDKRVQRVAYIREIIESKIARHAQAKVPLSFTYGTVKGHSYSEEEDVFLVEMVHRHGYGSWDKILQEIATSHKFHFDWFFKSRNSAELAKRVETLIRVIENENNKRRITDDPYSNSSQPLKKR